MSVHYFSYPRVTVFFSFFCLTAWRKKHKSKMQKTKVHIFCFFLYSSWSRWRKKKKDMKLMRNAENYIKGDENFMKCVSPWTWFKVEVLRRGANLGATEIEDSLWCRSFFRFCVCFSFLLCNLTMTIWMGSIGKKVKNRAVEVNVVGSCEG